MNASIAQYDVNVPMPVAPLVFVKDGGNVLFCLFVFVGTFPLFDPIIIGASWNGCHLDEVDDLEIVP
jgi:hypothetical protein